MAAETHYILHGIAEGRSIASFDALRYIASNADLARGYGTDTVAATHHYVEHGLAEGRSATAFDPLRYLASNPDLARGFGTDAAAAERHYIQYGLAERRSATAFDPVAYLAANADLARGYRYDLAAAETHYIQAGLREGRATGGFDAVAYLLSNRDLATGGLTVQQALIHWITNGAAEGRSGDATYGREQTSHAVAVGGVVADALQGAGDRDWFGIALSAGQHVAIRTHGTGFTPILAIADEHGVQRAFATGAGADAAIDFTADHAATFYLTTASASGAAGNYIVDVHMV